MIREAFQAYLYQDNKEGSGKASSYLRALELLQAMLREQPCGFEDCRDLWSVDSVERLEELRQRVLGESKLGEDSVWHLEGLPPSYLQDGYCSAALRNFQQFLVEHRHEQALLAIFESHQGEESILSEKLNSEPSYPKFLLDEIEGKDAVRSAKARVNQGAFRKIILRTYQNTCCLTGLDLPAINRASHIIGWAERTDTRMDPRNGLCFSATYDAAFDRKLISFDDDYRLVLSKTIRDHVPHPSHRDYFLSREGQRIDLPARYSPLKDYLKVHRKGGEF